MAAGTREHRDSSIDSENFPEPSQLQQPLESGATPALLPEKYNPFSDGPIPQSLSTQDTIIAAILKLSYAQHKLQLSTPLPKITETFTNFLCDSSLRQMLLEDIRKTIGPLPNVFDNLAIKTSIRTYLVSLLPTLCYEQTDLVDTLNKYLTTPVEHTEQAITLLEQAIPLLEQDNTHNPTTMLSVLLKGTTNAYSYDAVLTLQKIKWRSVRIATCRSAILNTLVLVDEKSPDTIEKAFTSLNSMKSDLNFEPAFSFYLARTKQEEQ